MEPMTFDTPGDLTVELRIPSGSIRARATDTETTHLDISGDRPDQIEVDLRPFAGGHKLVVTTRKSAGMAGWKRRIDVELVVPSGSALSAETGSADVETSGEFGSLSVRSGSGDLAFERVTGDVTAKVASGDIRGGEVLGDLTVHGASGDVEVRTVAGGLLCRTASGDVDIEELGGSAQVTGASGDIDLGTTSRGTLALRSVSGDITVGVAPGTGVWLDLASTSGDAVSELGDLAEPAADAALEIRATAVSGDIRVFSSRAAVGR